MNAQPKQPVTIKFYVDDMYKGQKVEERVVYVTRDGRHQIYFDGCRRTLTSVDPYVYEQRSRTLKCVQ